ncbi:hypothetical protein [Capnocytophaga canimorsus]|uniref:hypothetical protein n=1 Tax=Capnocytophaga canimorsus TaxID=28188 RepID=UPI001562D5EA|nr:hypothetical protein [Capnocytophaga canimorsus]
MNTIEKHLTELCKKAIGEVSSEYWENISINITAIRKFVEVKAFYEEKGNFISFGSDVAFEALKLREEMYKLSPEKGAWFSVFLTIESNGQFHTHFEYDEKPKFDIEPSKEKYIDDLKTFPREEHLISQWLKDIINS